MGNVVLCLECPKQEMNLGVKKNIDAKINQELCTLFEEMGLGCRDSGQKQELKKHDGHAKNASCHVERCWKVLVHADYHHRPEGEEDVASSKLLLAL